MRRFLGNVLLTLAPVVALAVAVAFALVGVWVPLAMGAGFGLAAVVFFAGLAWVG